MMSELVVYDVVKNEGRDIGPTDNMLKPDWLRLFPSLQTVHIRTGTAYQFRFESLERSIETVQKSVKFIIDEFNPQKDTMTPFTF